MIAGIGTVIVAYLGANLAYFSTLSIETITESTAIAIDFGNKLGGDASDEESSKLSWLSIILAFGVALSTAGSVNGSIMTGGRSQLFFKTMSQL
jgi:amino acid transporter